VFAVALTIFHPPYRSGDQSSSRSLRRTVSERHDRVASCSGGPRVKSR
jgi:hypothetical protein